MKFCWFTSQITFLEFCEVIISCALCWHSRHLQHPTRVSPVVPMVKVESSHSRSTGGSDPLLTSKSSHNLTGNKVVCVFVVLCVLTVYVLPTTATSTITTSVPSSQWCKHWKCFITIRQTSHCKPPPCSSSHHRCWWDYWCQCCRWLWQYQWRVKTGTCITS